MADNALRDPGIYTFAPHTKEYERTGLETTAGQLVAADPGYKAVDLLELYDAKQIILQAQCQPFYDEGLGDDTFTEINPDEIWVKVKGERRLEIVLIYHADRDLVDRVSTYSGAYCFSLMTDAEVQAMNEHAIEAPQRIAARVEEARLKAEAEEAAKAERQQRLMQILETPGAERTSAPEDPLKSDKPKKSFWDWFRPPRR